MTHFPNKGASPVRLRCLLVAMAFSIGLTSERIWSADLVNKEIYDSFAPSDAIVAVSNAGCYGVRDEALWNPMKTEYNALEWYDKEPAADTHYGVQWTVSLPEAEPGKYIFSINYVPIGEGCTWVLADESGKVLDRNEVEGIQGDGSQIAELELKIPGPGNYSVEVRQDGSHKYGFMGGRISKYAFLRPLN